MDDGFWSNFFRTMGFWSKLEEIKRSSSSVIYSTEQRGVRMISICWVTTGDVIVFCISSEEYRIPDRVDPSVRNLGVKFPLLLHK